LTATATSFPLSKHTEGGDIASSFLRPECLFTVHMGSGSSSLSCGAFLPLPLLEAFLLLIARCVVPLLPSPAGLFIYTSHRKWVFPLSCGVFLPPPLLQAFPLLIVGCVPLFLPSPPGLLWGISPPPLFSAQGSLPSLLHVFFVLIAYYSVFFLFSLGGGWSVRGLCWSGPGLSVGVLSAAYLTLWSTSSQAIWALASGHGTGALLVPLFNMKWRCYVQDGGVEESKFCLFSVVFPVRCISSISPRFYIRRHTFCFLPLATILESL
jgi:hypothetical protein